MLYTNDWCSHSYRFIKGGAVKAIAAFQKMMLRQAGIMILVTSFYVSNNKSALLAIYVN